MTLMGCEVIERPVLTGMDIAIKIGDKLYVWPDFVCPAVLKFIEVPEILYEPKWDRMQLAEIEPIRFYL